MLDPEDEAALLELAADADTLAVPVDFTGNEDLMGPSPPERGTTRGLATTCALQILQNG